MTGLPAAGGEVTLCLMVLVKSTLSQTPCKPLLFRQWRGLPVQLHPRLGLMWERKMAPSAAAAAVDEPKVLNEHSAHR